MQVQIWNGNSEDFVRILRPGDDVLVLGEVKTSIWLDKHTDENRYRLVINALQVMPAALFRRCLCDEYIGPSY